MRLPSIVGAMVMVVMPVSSPSTAAGASESASLVASVIPPCTLCDTFQYMGVNPALARPRHRPDDALAASYPLRQPRMLPARLRGAQPTLSAKHTNSFRAGGKSTRPPSHISRRCRLASTRSGEESSPR